MPIATSNFLVPNGTIIVEVVAFVILLVFIGKWILPFVNAQVEERQQQIRESLEQADAARAEADETRAKRQEILDEARHQAREIVAQANRTADQLRVDAQERGQQEFDRLVASAQAEISLARQRAVDDVTAQVGALVMAVAREVIGREVDAEVHRALIDEAVAALAGPAPAAPAASKG
jgi:F-type H+-transporting ATPase subunit b